MRISFEIARAAKATAVAVEKAAGTLSSVPGTMGGWISSLIREPFSGAWQRNMEVKPDTVLAFHAVYACVSLIAADIGKLRPKLVALDNSGIWNETTSASFSPVLRKPNGYQNHIQFKEWWIVSKLMRGNAYALKQRDQRGVVVGLSLLDPSRVQVLVSSNGEVFYNLGQDYLSDVATEQVQVPASEIIHDRMSCLFHPLVGVSPIFACGAAADQGLRIQENSRHFFGNNSYPGGILLAPAQISDETAARIKTHWDENFTGAKSGRVAVLGDGMSFVPMRMNAVDSQLIEQLKWTAEVVCSCFHVPAYMVGVGNAPTYNNIEALNQQYYTQCLQTLIESMELCLDEGLALDAPKDGKQLGVELDLTGLLRMDTSTQYKAIGQAVKDAVMTPNEGRRQINLPPLAGGDTVFLQQQQFSLAALAKRDARDDPFSTSGAASASAPTPVAPPDDGAAADADPKPPTPDAAAKAMLAEIVRGVEEAMLHA